MKRVLILLAMFALLGANAWASVPDPDYCNVHKLDIWVRAFGGDPIDNAYVEVIINGLCEGLCICDCAVFTDYSDVTGHAEIWVKMGGCCNTASAVIIEADGVDIRAADWFVSPDYDGAVGNCQVVLPDFIHFSNFYGQVGGVGCADYDGDGNCLLVGDFIIFGAAWGRVCVPE
jgi:hypothetical protein